MCIKHDIEQLGIPTCFKRKGEEPAMGSKHFMKEVPSPIGHS